VSLRFILARRTLVGAISCITLYHSSLITSVVQTSCRFFHTLVHCVFGYMVSIFMFFMPVRACAIICSCRYMCCRSFAIFSLVFSYRIYALSRVYTCRYFSFPRVFQLCGGFSCSLVSCNFRSHSAVIIPSFRLCVYMRNSSSALHFASMCVVSHSPMLFGR